MILPRASDRIEPLTKYKGTLNAFWCPEYFSFDAVCGSIVVLVAAVIIVVVAWLSSVAEDLAENDAEIGNKRSRLGQGKGWMR